MINGLLNIYHNRNISFLNKKQRFTLDDTFLVGQNFFVTL